MNCIKNKLKYCFIILEFNFCFLWMNIYIYILWKNISKNITKNGNLLIVKKDLKAFSTAAIIKPLLIYLLFTKMLCLLRLPRLICALPIYPCTDIISLYFSKLVIFSTTSLPYMYLMVSRGCVELKVENTLLLLFDNLKEISLLARASLPKISDIKADSL